MHGVSGIRGDPISPESAGGRMAGWGAGADVQLIAQDAGFGDWNSVLAGGMAYSVHSCSGFTPLARSARARASVAPTRSRRHARSGGRPTPDRPRLHGVRSSGARWISSMVTSPGSAASS